MATARGTPLSYTGALERLEEVEARDAAVASGQGRSLALTHGRRVERAIVLLHGLANCPRQMALLGQQLAERGYNVFIPRLPHHGLADRMTEALADLTAGELLDATREALDIAHGLGEHVSVAGLSMGGVLAAWCAQQRPDVGQAVLIAPMLAPPFSKEWLTRPFVRWLLHRPNAFWWWDPRLREALLPDYAYPRFSTWALARLYQLADAVMADAARTPPSAPSILAIGSRRDPAVSNGATRRLIDRWRRHGRADVRWFCFGAELPWLHDVIDPGQPAQRIALVYPRLLDLITARPVGAR
jgi:esterase/lipase